MSDPQTRRRVRLCRLKPLTLLVGVALLPACGSDPVVPEDPGSAGDGTLAEALEFVRDAHGLPALAGVMVYQGRVVEMAAVGTRAAGGPESVTVDDLWHIGSCTKRMTATLIGLAVERNELRWDDLPPKPVPHRMWFRFWGQVT